MAATPSRMIELRSPAPDFALPDTNGNVVSREDFVGSPLLVGFVCNHCPFVKHIARRLGDLTAAYVGKGVGVVLINSNDPTVQPEDAPGNMPEFMEDYGIRVPYLFDETQEVAQAYQATCTPDFFLYDGTHHLVYRGQFDDSRPGNEEPVTGADLSAAVDAVLQGAPPLTDQKPSMGCNIKWRPGNEPPFSVIG
ncbi:MAG: thioredoxin family protein [Alkalispirochaeta sp.]